MNVQSDTKVPSFNTTYIFTISMVSALGGLLFGFDISVISGTIPFIRQVFHLTEVTLGWAVSSALIGCILGTFLAGAPSDKFGRRNLLIVSAVLFAISAIGVGLSWSLDSFVIFRLIGGLGVGMASTLSPVYIAEIAPASIRGRFVSLNQLTIVIGILAAYFTNYLLADIGPNNWRWMYATEAAPALLFFIGLFFVPESPRWLIKRGREDDATSIFKNVGGIKFANKVIDDIKRSLANENKGRLRDLIKPELRFVVILGIVLAVFQQWCGINVIFFYAPDIFQKAGIGIHSALFRTILIGVVNLTFTILAMWLVDKVGRKKLLLIGAAGMIVSYSLIGICFFFHLFGGFYLILLVLFAIAFYATSLAPVVWVLISEIYPNRIRGIAMSVATFFLWVASFLLTLTFPILQNSIGDAYTFWLYAAICLAGWLFVVVFVPETKGKSLEELEDLLIKA
ncbi:MAG TPA: sugar porter family MFS transporter [Balneolales bacterium]|nr:sugar porter family MFS transporter [Balneolales bacterium]